MSVSSASTPLLHNLVQADPYDRFSPRDKKLITFIISLAGIIAPFAAQGFIPAISQIAQDLNTTGEAVNYTVGAYILLIAIGSLIWAPYAEFYGRKPVYLCCLPIVTIGSIITACAQSISMLVVGRCIQAFGASCLQEVGVATISDIYRLEQRGTGMGTFFAAILLGLPLAPLIGGALATYTSWRFMQLLLATMGLGVAFAVLIFLPETSHVGVRGLDTLLAKERARSTEDNEEPSVNWRWVWLSPFSTLTLLKSPVILLLVLSSAFALMAYYALTVPLAFTIGKAYGLNTPAAIGLCFLPAGAGNMTGATLAGRIADGFVIHGKERRQLDGARASWYPEDRLKATIPGVLVLLPFSLIIFSFAVEYIPGKIGLVICLVCLFLNGMGIDSVLTPSATYLVDIVRHRGVEVMALSGAFRHVFSAASSAAVLPIINCTSIIVANGVVAICAWIAFGLLVTLIVNGKRLRTSVDIGYTT